MPRKIFYVQVIEAREVISRIATTTLQPSVTVKYNNSVATKKTTSCKPNKTHWAEIFTFEATDPSSDVATFELRERGYHVMSSDWIGEVQIKLSDYDDGLVHLKWFRLGESKLKKHTKRPRGVLLLKIHLTTRDDKPFYKTPVEKPLSYEQWLEYSEAHYADKIRNPNASDDYYPVNNGLNTKPRSLSQSEGGSARKATENVGKSRSQSVSEKPEDIFSRGTNKTENAHKNLYKSKSERKNSKTEADSVFEKETSLANERVRSLSKSQSIKESSGKMAFPISPISGSPMFSAKPTGGIHPDLIDLSEGFAAASIAPTRPMNPFGVTNNPFLNMDLSMPEKKAPQVSSNPFLEPGETLGRAAHQANAFAAPHAFAAQ